MNSAYARFLSRSCFSLVAISCSDTVEVVEPEITPGTPSEAGGGTSSPGDGDIDLDTELGGAGGVAQPAGKPPLITDLPDGFIGGLEISQAPNDPDAPHLPGKGGWKVVGPIESVDLENNSECANILRTVMRDFRESHSDFQTNTWLGNVQNIVTDRGLLSLRSGSVQ